MSGLLDGVNYIFGLFFKFVLLCIVLTVLAFITVPLTVNTFNNDQGAEIWPRIHHKYYESGYVYTERYQREKKEVYDRMCRYKANNKICAYTSLDEWTVDDYLNYLMDDIVIRADRDFKFSFSDLLPSFTNDGR